jgi:hypothetical protein
MNVLCLIVVSMWTIPLVPEVVDAPLLQMVRPLLICKGMTPEQVRWVLNERPADRSSCYSGTGYFNGDPKPIRELYLNALVAVYYNPTSGRVDQVSRLHRVSAAPAAPLPAPARMLAAPLPAPARVLWPAVGIDPPPPSKAGGKEVAPGVCTCTCTPSGIAK